MKDSIINTFKLGLVGKGIHVDPREALKELSPAIARKKPDNNEGVHSCWELLHHIVVWQDAMIEAIKGNDVDWGDIAKTRNWPSEDMLADDANFTNLVLKFEKGIEEAKKLIKSVNYYELMPAWENHPKILGINVLLQHNSYHIGQIVIVRKLLKDHPPSNHFF
ncbi:MAG: DinB family protein [Promethearchaeota archaeon]